mgnify:FL=1
MKNKEIPGIIMVVIAGVLWGTTGTFVRTFSALGLSSLQISVFKVVIAAIILFLYTAIFKRDMLKIKLKDVWIFIAAGIISLDFFTICYFSTIQNTSLSVAAVLLYTAPAFVMLMSVMIFKEKITVRKIIACLMAFVGCALTAGIIGNGFSVPAKSLLTGVLSGFGYALYSIFGEIALRKGYKPLTITTYSFLFSVIGFVFIIKPKEIMAAAEKAPSYFWFFGMMVVMSVAVSLLPYVCYTNGLTRVNPSKASIIASVEPITATLVGAIAFKEYPDFYGILGIVCVVAAIVLLNIKIKRAHDSKTVDEEAVISE